jgi:hypothetical protein
MLHALAPGGGIVVHSDEAPRVVDFEDETGCVPEDFSARSLDCQRVRLTDVGTHRCALPRRVYWLVESYFDAFLSVQHYLEDVHFKLVRKLIHRCFVHGQLSARVKSAASGSRRSIC